MEGDKKMPTKTLTKEETLPASALRSLSQKSLLEMVNAFDKLGVIVNNNLSIAMLSWEKYEQLVDNIQELQSKIDELESLYEDIQLAKEYKEDVERVEKGQSESRTFKSIDEIFDLLEKNE
ncbi:hypothetical protein ABEO87_13825 [Geobacillus stearothermophilus]|jgi:outer membrane murein-binding lipoprotein Lpp|nr:hypothetical protein [Geobacillus sp. DSP4a]AKU27535.1 hypothetical protein IB49_15330 [Geobacillus sp. LC300]ATA59332.1 hypothetical protein GS458_0876 [Geobacillus stearothermophilus]ATA61472.1 hypothetical protein GS458_3045 [Geobacillus stearothermophilus]KZE91997.1 hypothetical protein AVP43_03222 [Geobacillus stearothermophilus]NNV00875.1 hypothetical protein [Geobacillus sp. DSP4a]